MVMVIYIVSFIDKIEIIKINNELAGASTGNILISGRFMLNRPVLSINYRLTYFASIKFTPQPQS
ncbi:hypothetical protein D7V79_03720 [Escherichia coli]|nr:hypothetical protein [Escherichia coli]